MESDKYGREWHGELSRGPPSGKPIPKGDQLLVLINWVGCH